MKSTTSNDEKIGMHSRVYRQNLRKTIAEELADAQNTEADYDSGRPVTEYELGSSATFQMMCIMLIAALDEIDRVHDILRN